MGIWYTLKNGKKIKINVRDCSAIYEPDVLVIELFGGSMRFEYKINNALNLNEILEEIEKNYDKYEEEDSAFEYSCWCD